MLPALAGAKTTVPSCSHFSASAIARVIGTGPLQLAGPAMHNFCSYDGKPTTGFLPFVSVHPSPATQSIFSLSERDAKKSAISQRATFGTLRIGPAAAWYVMSTHSPGAGQPSEIKITVGAYGPYRSTGAKITVSAGVAAQVGVGKVTLAHMTLLVKEILSGQIR